MNLPHETHPTIANLQARIRELEGKEQNKASLAAEMRAEVVDPCTVKPLDRLIVSFPDNGTDWDRKMLASCGLKKGDLVTVQAGYVNSWSSTFTLVGHGGNRFNSVFFSAYNERQGHTVFQQENEKALTVLARHKGDGDLSMFVLRLARTVKRLEPDNTVAAMAVRYLQNNGLTSALRNDQDLPDQDISETLADLEAECVKSARLERKLADANARIAELEALVK